MNLTFMFCVAFSFFFSFFVSCSRGQWLLFMNSNCTFPTFSSLLSYQWIPQYCSWSHKFHFSTTFSLKLDPTTPFTYLKIILLQCFQFQFLVSTTISSIQTDPKIPFQIPSKTNIATISALNNAIFFFSFTSHGLHSLHVYLYLHPILLAQQRHYS